MHAPTQQDVRFRTPVVDDGAAIWQLVHDDGGLDLNSPYMYLLVCTDWAATSVIAEDDEGLLGFVAAYRPPQRQEAVFVWQVGVAKRARRRGLGRKLLHRVLDQPANLDVEYLTATVTPDNDASMALFRRLAADLRVPCETAPRFAAEHFPGEGHEPEAEFVIGPIAPDQRATHEESPNEELIAVPTKTDPIEHLESEVRSYCRMWPATFEKASGSQMWDVDGNEYLDLFAGAGALNYGHNDPEMRQAVVDHLLGDNLVHSLDQISVPKKRFLERFEEVILKPRGFDWKVQFPGPTGANAVEAAMKLARKITGREQVVGFTNAFHGMTIGALAVSGNSMKRDGAGVGLTSGSSMPYDGYFGDEVDTIEYLDRLLADDGSGFEKPAAVIVETVQAEGGLATASSEWLQDLRALCTKHDVVMIVDDIQAGCGRTGRFFSFEDSGIEPDIVTISKSLSGFGMPFALTLFRRDLDIWDPGEHNGTFRGFTPAMITATVALDRWTDDTLPTSTERKAGVVSRALDELVEKHPDHVIERRGRGLLQGIEMAPGLAKKVAKRAFDLRVIVETSGPNDEVLKLLPALTISNDQLAEGLSRITTALEDVIGESGADSSSAVA